MCGWMDITIRADEFQGRQNTYSPCFYGGMACSRIYCVDLDEAKHQGNVYG